MLQLWKMVMCITIAILYVVYAEQTSTKVPDITTTLSLINTTTDVNTSSSVLLDEESKATNNTESLPIIAAKLVRQRRQHPRVIVRHVVLSSKRGSKSRRRSKPPNYNTGSPITYYKPTKQYLPEISNSPKYSPIDEVDLINHFSSANYDLHSENGQQFEDQTMDLDFYGHSIRDNDFEEPPKLSSHHVEYSSYDTKRPTYSYTSSKTSKPLTSYDKRKKYKTSTYSNSDESSYDGGGDDSYTYSLPEKSYDMHPMSSYKSPSSSQASKYYDFTSLDTNSQSNIHIPAAKYGVPDFNIHYPAPAKKPDYQAPKPTSSDNYIIYEKNIPNSGYSSIQTSSHHHFAEPPTKTKVDITYSPSYEITLPASNDKPAPVEHYNPTPGNFAEPPAPPPPQRQTPPTPVQAPHPPPPPPPSYNTPKTSMHPPPIYRRFPKTPSPPVYKQRPKPPPKKAYQAPERHVPPPQPSSPPPSYQQPEQEPELELDSNEPNSFENADLQEPPSFDISKMHELPPSFHIPDSHQSPPSFQVPQPPIQPPSDSFELPEPQSPNFYSSSQSKPSEQSHEPNFFNTHTRLQTEYPQPDYITPSQDLPINVNYMPPTYNYPKSSYEVPIYDPIPFEASSAEEQETFPPNNFDDNQHIDDSGHTQSASSPIATSNLPTTHITNNQEEDGTVTRTTKGFRPSNKRKSLRTHSTQSDTTKHILDTPELEEAYEANYRQKNQLALNNDADVNESNHVVAKPSNNKPNYFLPTVTPDIVNEQIYISPAWNPIRLRAAVSTPTALPAATAVKAQTSTATSTPRSTLLRSKGRRQQVGRITKPKRQQETSSSFTPSLSNGFIPMHDVTTNTRQTTPLQPNKVREEVAIVSIDKSRSFSYYDGTAAPPKANERKHAERTRSSSTQNSQQQSTHSGTLQNQKKTTRAGQQPTRIPATSMRTRQRAPTRDQTTPLRTTKSVYETTYFNSPHNDYFERHLDTYLQTLPKNHKWL